MANDRMYLKCVGCGERLMIAKTFGGADGYQLCVDDCRIGEFLAGHALCNMENSDEFRHQDFVLEYESQDTNNGWIPVTEDTMPRCYRIDDEKRSDRLLFVTKDEQIHIGFYSYCPIGEWCCEDAALDIPCSSGEVTHWQPLPGKKTLFEQ